MHNINIYEENNVRIYEEDKVNIYDEDKGIFRGNPSTGVYNVLILEDEKSVNNNLADQIVARSKKSELGQPTFIVYRAYDYSEAVLIIRAVKIDIFLLDVYLDGKRDKKHFVEQSGFQFAKALRGKEKLTDGRGIADLYDEILCVDEYQYKTPIIFLTSEDREKRQLPIHDEVFPISYLKKPYSFNSVWRTLEHAVFVCDMKYDVIIAKKANRDDEDMIEISDILWVCTNSREDVVEISFRRRDFKIIKTDFYLMDSVKLLNLTSFIKLIPQYSTDPIYFINPIHAKEYDEETNEIVIEYNLPDFKVGEERISVVHHRKQLKMLFKRILADAN